MVKRLLKRAIEQKNAFMSEDMIRLQMEFFLGCGKITQEEYEELVLMLPSIQEEVNDGGTE